MKNLIIINFLKNYNFFQALVTPLGALFWSVFDFDGCGGFFWEPHADYLTYFSIVGIILIVPAIILYNAE